MVAQRKSRSATPVAQELGFTSIAAQELDFTSIRGEGPSSCATWKTKRRRAMRRSDRTGEGKYKPTKRFLSSEEAPVHGRLFPDLPDEITWTLIVPKLSWRALPILAAVSRAWKEAIRSNRAYEEKVRAKSLETLIIHFHTDAIAALYSPGENCCYDLPPFPRDARPKPGYIWQCKCVAVGGKIYILGGVKASPEKRVWKSGRLPKWNASEKVYVLDLGRGQSQWEQCASMLVPRHSFVFGVLDEKIYVFGGRTTALKERVTNPFTLRSEVYATRENAWSQLMPTTFAMRPCIDFGGYAIAAPVGKELFSLDGYMSRLKVYSPAKDEWRFERFWERDLDSEVFTTDGRFYSLSLSGIDVYDVEQKSWISRHTHSFATFRPNDSAILRPQYVSALNDELFLTAVWCNDLGRKISSQSFHCKGFDGEQEEMVWQKTNCTFEIRDGDCVQLPIQL